MCLAFAASAAYVETASSQANALFSGRFIPRIQIEISEEDYEVLRTEKRRSSRNMDRTNVFATVREGSDLYTNVMLHLKGSASFRSVEQKPSFTLNFDKLVEKQRFHGLEKISLNNSMHDPAFVNECLGRELFAKVGIPVPRVTHAVVSLNGRDLGIYVLVEGWNKQFLKRHFRDTNGNLYERAPNARDIPMSLEVKSGEDPEDHRALEALADAIEESDPDQRWKELERTLDLDRFITGMALEIMIGHWDGYCRNQNNYRIFHDRIQDRLVFMPHGMDQLFGTRRNAAEPALFGQMRGKVAAALLEVPEGRQRYLERMTQLHAQLFEVAALTNRVLEIRDRLAPLMQSDAGVARTNSEAIERILQRIPERHAAIEQQLKSFNTPIASGATEVIERARWESNRGTGNPSLTSTSAGGRNVLRISSNNTLTAEASWEAVALLDSGRYQFSANVMIEAQRHRTRPEATVTLRTSEARTGAEITLPQPWTNVVHEFTVPTKRFVTLICEYRGIGGLAMFEVESLALTRLAETGSEDSKSKESKAAKP